MYVIQFDIFGFNLMELETSSGVRGRGRGGRGRGRGRGTMLYFIVEGTIYSLSSYVINCNHFIAFPHM